MDILSQISGIIQPDIIHVQSLMFVELQISRTFPQLTSYTIFSDQSAIFPDLKKNQITLNSP